MEGLRQDVHYALRTLRKTPGYTAFALLTVALGTGASTAVFSMVNGVLLRALPYPNADRVVRLTQPQERNAGTDAGFSVVEVGDFRAARTLDGVAEYHSMPFQLYGRGEPQRVQTGVVSDVFFDLLGVRPLLGRLFARGEDAIGAPPVVVLSYRYWRERLGGDPAVVGSTFTMNDKIHQIIGVLPPLPAYPDDNDIWMPAGACPFRSDPSMMNMRNMRMVQAFGRIRAGADVSTARAEVAAVARRQHDAYPSAYRPTNPLGIATTQLFTELTGQARPILFTLLAASGFLLLIAAANFTNLTLARQLRRSHEFTLRGALGAGGGRLVRQLAVESLCITVPGGALGTLIALAGLGVFRRLAERVTPRASDIGLDIRVLGFAVLLSILVGMLAGVAPFARVRRTLSEAARRGNAASDGPREGRLRSTLVTVQLTVAFVVLVAAGLMTRSLLLLERVDRMPDAASVATARVDLDWTRYTSNAQARLFSDQLLERLEGTPGVETAAIASDFPLNSAQPFRVPFLVSRAEGEAASMVRADITSVGPGYFAAMGIPLLAGRVFTAADRDTISAPAIVGQRFARTYWPGHDPVGQRVSADSGLTWHTVVGVVGDVHQNSLSGELTDEVYLPFASSPSTTLRVLIRTRGASEWVEGRLRAVVKELDDKQPMDEFRTLLDVRNGRLTGPRLTTVLLLSFAGLALLITAAGVNGVVANSVGQRLREIAIRQALGATGRQIMASLLVPLLITIGVGLAAGVLVAAPLSRLMAGLLYQVRPTDVLTHATVGLMLAAVAVLAAVIPARMALRVDPVRVLRGE